MKQSQFLDVIDRDEAERRWRAAIDAAALEPEVVALDTAHGRVLADDVRAEVDVPGFDRSNMDGFAVRAADTFGASEEEPIRLARNDEIITTGMAPESEVVPGTATTIATGGMLPRGADAVVPVEHTDLEENADGASPSWCGTRAFRAPRCRSRAPTWGAARRCCSRARGSRRARRGCSPRSVRRGAVIRRPRVAILSTGDEIVQPGEAMRPGLVYDSNGRILADAVRELGGEPWFLGAFRDDEGALRAAVQRAVADADLVLLSGGTSKGEGDLNALVGRRARARHHRARRCAQARQADLSRGAGRKPVVILPGFPTSAIFTFHEFVAPVLRSLSGFGSERRETVKARLAMRVVSERGRLEYLLVGLVRRAGAAGDGASDELAAYAMGKGSGSVTSFSRADGFARIDRNTEIVEAEEEVEVTLIGREVPVADLVVIGSHCAGSTS